MKKRSIISIIPALLSSALLSPAWADQGSDSGAYISGGIGANKVRSGIPEQNTRAFRLSAGWQFNPNFAIELAYDDYGDFPGPTPAFSDFDLRGTSIALVGQLPVSSTWALYAKAGQSWWSADSSYFFFGRNSGINQTGILEFSEADIFYGVGASYELSEAIALELEYNAYDFEFPSHSTFNHKSAALLLSVKYEL